MTWNMDGCDSLARGSCRSTRGRIIRTARGGMCIKRGGAYHTHFHWQLFSHPCSRLFNRFSWTSIFRIFFFKIWKYARGAVTSPKNQCPMVFYAKFRFIHKLCLLKKSKPFIKTIPTWNESFRHCPASLGNTKEK